VHHGIEVGERHGNAVDGREVNAGYDLKDFIVQARNHAKIQAPAGLEATSFTFIASTDKRLVPSISEARRRSGLRSCLSAGNQSALCISRPSESALNVCVKGEV
jgi:hypothetical protein